MQARWAANIVLVYFMLICQSTPGSGVRVRSLLARFVFQHPDRYPFTLARLPASTESENGNSWNQRLNAHFSTGPLTISPAWKLRRSSLFVFPWQL